MSEILKYLKAHRTNLENELVLVIEAIAAVEDCKQSTSLATLIANEATVETAQEVDWGPVKGAVSEPKKKDKKSKKV